MHLNCIFRVPIKNRQILSPSPLLPLSLSNTIGNLDATQLIVRQGLVALLNHESDVKFVAQASNGQEAVTMFRQHQPDVTLMDLRMPLMDGVVAIAAICAEFPRTRIVLLTTYDGDENIYRGLQAGAKGYLLKDAKRSF